MSELTERLERERIRELELVSQRHELEVRFAYNAMLEERVVDHANQIGLLHGHINAAAEHYAAERQRVDADFEARYGAIAGELSAERERLAEAQRTIEETQRERDDARAELAAERQRLSYRAVQGLAIRVKRHRYLSALLRRAARLFRR